MSIGIQIKMQKTVLAFLFKTMANMQTMKEEINLY